MCSPGWPRKQSNADIASNSAGGISTLSNCQVWGDASCNTGAMTGTTNVHGSMYSNFSSTPPNVAKPVWSTFNVSPAAVTNPVAPVTLTGGPSGSPQNYKLTDLTLSNNAKPLILAPHVPGQEVTGTTTLNTTGIILQQPGVHVQFYGEGSILLRRRLEQSDRESGEPLSLWRHPTRLFPQGFPGHERHVHRHLQWRPDVRSHDLGDRHIHRRGHWPGSRLQRHRRFSLR